MIASLGCFAATQAARADDRFAQAERAHYAALCRAHKDLDSCSDAVRWSPGDAVLVAALADALVRAGRLEEAIRDYRRAEVLEPRVRGLDPKINAAQARLAAARRARRRPTPGPVASEQVSKRYSNADPESQSH